MGWLHSPLPCVVNAYLFQAPVQAGEPEDTILVVSRKERSPGLGNCSAMPKQHYHQHRCLSIQRNSGDDRKPICTYENTGRVIPIVSF
jgi:hypothetical protein